MTDLCFVQSGSIVDGLAFFKKNVSSHFEGQSECAICYSCVYLLSGLVINLIYTWSRLA